MPIDASIYQQIKPIEMPSFADAASKGMAMSQLAKQNQRLDQQMATEDKDAKYTDHVRKLSVVGSALDSLSKLPPEQKSVAYPKIRAQLIQSGMIGEQDAPPEYDESFVSPLTAQYQASAAGIENALKTAQVKKLQTEVEDIPEERKLKRNLTLSEIVKNYSEAAKHKAETPDRTATLGQTNDPAVLVPLRVPKEHQAKAFGEIDAAENTKRMAESIMSAFDQSVGDTSGFGSVTSQAKTPRSVMALHQAMQPTFKDLEGTVRQAAMDNTFKNITPTGFDTAEDIATRRAALESYLKSKLSAPTARAYGIDLSKFDSTAPYEGTAPKTPANNGGMGEKTANAAPPAPPAIRMMAPDGSVRWIPASQKGEAIAAGGKVVQ